MNVEEYKIRIEGLLGVNLKAGSQRVFLECFYRLDDGAMLCAEREGCQIGDILHEIHSGDITVSVANMDLEK